MDLATYLMFDGTCREAFEFYRQVFGGEFSFNLTYAEGPADLNVPDEDKDRIMHISLPISGSVLMGSDSTSAYGPPPTRGDNFAISIAADSREQCDELFAKLSAGGNNLMPMQDQFWGAYFGCLTDKFGVGWMVSFEEEEQPQS